MFLALYLKKLQKIAKEDLLPYLLRVLAFIFGYLIHFELIFKYGVGKRSVYSFSCGCLVSSTIVEETVFTH